MMFIYIVPVLNIRLREVTCLFRPYWFNLESSSSSRSGSRVSRALNKY